MYMYRALRSAVPVARWPFVIVWRRVVVSFQQHIRPRPQCREPVFWSRDVVARSGRMAPLAAARHDAADCRAGSRSRPRRPAARRACVLIDLSG